MIKKCSMAGSGCFIILALLSPIAGAQVYKCTKGGSTSFSDAPCTTDAQVTKMRDFSAPAAQSRPIQDGETECKRTGPRVLSMKDPESARVSVVHDKMVVIDHEGAKLTARRYYMGVNAKNSYGAYEGEKVYFCYTSDDGLRVLSIRSKATDYK